VLKSLEATKDQRIESVNAIKQQKIDAIYDAVAQRIQTAEDTTEINNNETLDLGTNQFIERQQQQRDIEGLLYAAEYGKEEEASWEAYLKYAKAANATIIQRTDARIFSLERIGKAVQAATEKRKIALLQEAYQKIHNALQTETASCELYTIHEELPQMTEEELREENANIDNKHNYDDDDNGDSNKNDNLTEADMKMN